jgi:CxxC motif-containing protein (DUF1111 family)
LPPTQTTANSPFTGQSKVTFQPFSDFQLHDMGALADGVSQLSAGRPDAAGESAASRARHGAGRYPSIANSRR